MEAVRKNAAPAVSVIIPVYNAKKYLDQCIRSVLDQTFTDFEIILVDDGSTDGSGEICDRYGRQDSRVRVFHKQNGGVSSARNMGLDHAAGKWITFVDSDDYLSDNAFQPLDMTGSDELVICSYSVISENSHIEASEANDCLLEGKSLIQLYQAILHAKTLRVVWGKFFSSEIVGEMRFDENIRYGEDYLFMLAYLKKVHSCQVCRQLIYVYRDSGDLCWKKYECDVKTAVYVMSKLFDAYLSLKAYSVPFERWLFLDYRKLCRRDIDRNLQLWYGNADVKRIYDKIKRHLGPDFRIRYRLLSVKCIAGLNRQIKNIIQK